jgi:quercetin dioxygenase-like cupin family protein
MSEGTVISDILAEVQIPKDGTLSRVLYKDDYIRLVAFAFDRGQELTDHTAGVPVTIHVVTGRLQVTIGQDAAEIGPKSWVQIPAGMTHAVEAIEPSVMVLTLLKASG